jgi:hypothetical protein
MPSLRGREGAICLTAFRHYKHAQQNERARTQPAGTRTRPRAHVRRTPLRHGVQEGGGFSFGTGIGRFFKSLSTHGQSTHIHTHTHTRTHTRAHTQTYTRSHTRNAYAQHARNTCKRAHAITRTRTRLPWTRCPGGSFSDTGCNVQDVPGTAARPRDTHTHTQTHALARAHVSPRHGVQGVVFGRGE